jgi:membrane fusion protein (multidrug efflux system)
MAKTLRREGEINRPTIVGRVDNEPVRDDAVTAFTPSAEKPPAPAPATKSPPVRRSGRLRRPLLVGGPLLVAIGALALYLHGGRWASTDDAYVKADIASIATDVPGTVASIAVHNDQHVAAGDVLYRLDDTPYRLAYEGAKAALESTADQIASFQKLYRNQMASVQTAKTDVAYYKITTQRATDLLRSAAGTQATLDQAHHDLQSAQNRVDAAQLQADSLLAYLGGSADLPVERYPQYLKAKAALDKAARDLDHTTVRAPAAGVVTNVDALQVGNVMAAGQSAFSLVASDHVWIEGNFKETDLTHVRPGNKAEISVDTYPDVEWTAQVETISPATGAQFSVLPAQNSSGNWVKVVQRIPVRLRVETPDGAPTLRAGMSVVIDVDTGHKRTFGGLIDGLRRLVGV